MAGEKPQATGRPVQLEVDGPDVHTSNIDAATFLDLAAAFFQLLRVNASELGLSLALSGIEIVEKCATVVVFTDAEALAKECSALAMRQLEGGEPPRGGGHLVARALDALSAFPDVYRVKVRVGGWDHEVRLSAAVEGPPPDEILTIRAQPIRAGGKKPAVRFTSPLEDDFTLVASHGQARALGAMLYNDVDISARVTRDRSGAIEGGKLEGYEPVEDDDPRPAWREWFAAVGGGEHRGQ